MSMYCEHMQDLKQRPDFWRLYPGFIFEFFSYIVYAREVNSTFNLNKLLLVCLSSPVIPSLAYFMKPDKLMSWPDRGASIGMSRYSL